MRRDEIAAILQDAGSSPRHRLGQHFMVDQNILAQIAAAAELSSADMVLEIGPGPGNLTALLAEKAGAVLAVDIDEPLLKAAAGHARQLANVQWLCADVLAGKHQVNPMVVQAIGRLLEQQTLHHVKLVANLPYNVASPLVAELLALHWQGLLAASGNSVANDKISALRLERLVFTVQWEVAQRMRAGPGTSDYGALGVLIQLLGNVQIVRSIAPGSFWPPPKVRSALVLIRPDEEKMAQVKNVRQLQQTLTRLFSHRRQNLLNAIRHEFKSVDLNLLRDQLAAADLTEKVRAETLTPPQLLRLSEILPDTQQRRPGFLAGQITIPEDFDQLGRAEIERQFGGHE